MRGWGLVVGMALLAWFGEEWGEVGSRCCVVFIDVLGKHLWSLCGDVYR